MKLTGIQIDGFGVWRGLELPEIDHGITVFYGPNEAGKTTLLQFVRAMLYGASLNVRRRYLPPVAGGSAGGRLAIEGPTERLHVCRSFDPQDPEGDRLTVRSGSQPPRGGDELAALLGGIDEATFNNVYAVGLRELQELGTLSDTEAADWLYSLTTGVDRVSLLDVMQQLDRSREELLARDGSGGAIKVLMRERDALAAKIEQHKSRLGKWCLMQVRLEQLAGEIRDLHASQVELARESRTLEIAVQLAPRWREREDLDRRLREFQGQIRLPDDAMEKLDDLKRRIAGHERDAQVRRAHRQALREEADALGINEVLVRGASRVEALGEQRDWLDALERQSAAIRAELAEIQSQLESEDERLGAEMRQAAQSKDRPAAHPTGRGVEISEGMLNSLRPHGKALRTCRARLKTAEREAERKQAAVAEFEAQLQIAMPAASEGMPTDLEEAGEVVAALKRRIQVEQRLREAQRNEVELEEQMRALLDRQELPVWMEAAHTVLVIIGVALFAAGLLAGASAAAWIGGVMLVALLALRIFKYVGEEQVASRRTGVEKEIDVVRKQIRAAEREQKALQTELGPIEGSVVVKLQAAERHLAELEKLLPIDSKRRDAACEAESAEHQLVEARRQLAEAEGTWRGKLAALGLPSDWTPGDLRRMAGRYEQIAELRIRVTRRREDAEERQREHATLCERIRNLAEEVGLAGDEVSAPDLLARLLSELRGQQTKLADRRRLRKRGLELKAVEQRHLRAAAALRNRLENLFQQAGVEDEAGYRRLWDDRCREDELRRQREMLSREVAAAIGGHAPEDVFAALLERETPQSLETRWEESASGVEETAHQMHRLVEERGAIGRELEDLTSDCSAAECQLDLGVVNAKLEEAIRAWQVRAAACAVLERVRVHYEKHRQPETLREASRLLENFTGGRYRRVWTPLAKKLLFVDTRDGEALPVEVLSRGTREQLFLAIRLALVALFARRGVRLPLVLDDVLVNFDSRRAARAVEALAEFAETGHQVLVFTCHEHIAALFGSLGADVRELPDRFGDGERLALPTDIAEEPAEPMPIVVEVEEVLELTETDEELQVEPPVVTASPAYVMVDEVELEAFDDEKEYKLAEDEEELFIPEAEELELAPLDDEDTILEVAPRAEIPRPRPEPPFDQTADHEDLGEWIRIGPQVRRREFVTPASEAASSEDATDDIEYDAEYDNKLGDWYEEDLEAA